MEIRPQEGKQTEFLQSSADICIYGGGAGGGKTFGLLMEPLRHIHIPKFSFVIFRKSYPDIHNEGGLWDTSCELYPLLSARGSEHSSHWRFPSGATGRFSHLLYDKDVYSWQGSQIPLIMFDELTHFSEKMFFYMMSRNRSSTGISGYIRATCNPDPDSWVARFISWWIDKDSGYAIPERSGVLRWFVRINNTLVWADTADELRATYGNEQRPKSVTFIPAKISDNKILMDKDPAYVSSLMALPQVDRERLLGGNWKIRAAAGMCFKRGWFPVVPFSQVPVGGREIRYWDRACLPAGTMIHTSTGYRPIEKIKAGELVLTRQGYKPVVWSGLTKYVTKLVTIKTSGGNSVTATPEHRIWTVENGWLPFDSVNDCRYTMHICQKAHQGTKQQKPSPSTESFTGAILANTILKPSDGTRLKRKTGLIHCIGRFGDFTMEKFRRAMMCITRTRTNPTTPLRTSNASPARSITVFIMHLLSGTKPRQQRPCLQPTEKSNGITNPSKNISVLCVELGLNQEAAESQCIVQANAVKVPICPVYDLEVQDAHEFFANGVLVHNSSVPTPENPDPDWTVGLRIRYVNKKFYVMKMARDRLRPAGVETLIKNTASQDTTRVEQVLEGDPGSAGDFEIASYITLLAGYTVRTNKPTKNKYERAKPAMSQAEAGNIVLVEGDWHEAFFTELENFSDDPKEYAHDDITDTLSGGVNVLTVASTGFTSASGLRTGSAGPFAVDRLP